MKKSNKKLIAVVLSFLICVTCFAAAGAIGFTELLKAAVGGDPLEMLNSSSYENSSTLQDDFNTMFNALYWARADEENHDADGIVNDMTKQGIFFYVTDGKRVFTNLDYQGSLLGSGSILQGEGTVLGGPGNSQSGVLSAEELEQLGMSQGAYRLYANDKLTGSPSVDQWKYSSDRWMAQRLEEMDSSTMLRDENAGNEKTVLIAFSKDYVELAERTFNDLRGQLIRAISATLGLALGGIVALIALCIFCGKEDEAGRPALTGIDRWFTELILAAFAGAIFLVCGVCALAANSFQGYDYYHSYGYFRSGTIDINGFQVAAFAAGLWLTVALTLYLLMILVKKLKARRFLRDFFIVSIFIWIWGGLKDIYYGSSVMKKVIILVALMCLCSATVVFFPVVVVVSIIFAAKWVKQYEGIKNGVKEVKNGNPAYKIPIEGEPEGEFQQLAADINAISEGLDLAVKQELKNQRMKTELISNVSHDIKTPLTSIITYVDLLKKEGLDCPDAPKYLDILDQKSIRLKKLTEDLFEAAKASSGDIPVQIEKVDLLSLLNQTLGELDDRLSQKGLDVIVKADQERYIVEADGQLMWRVLENLFGNAIKYALENSRVYVDIRREEAQNGAQTVVLEMKNVSKNPLNIPADELMERFKRGDESRSTEGSGLGLAITRDLMSIQHGKFDLIIDGDLFKAVITLNVCQ